MSAAQAHEHRSRYGNQAHMIRPIRICSARRTCGSSATISAVRIATMSLASDLVSFVLQRTDAFDHSALDRGFRVLTVPSRRTGCFAPSAVGTARPSANARGSTTPSRTEPRPAVTPSRTTGAGVHTGQTAMANGIPSRKAPQAAAGRVARNSFPSLSRALCSLFRSCRSRRPS